MFGNIETMLTIITVCSAVQVVIAIFNILMLYIIKDDTEELRRFKEKKESKND